MTCLGKTLNNSAIWTLMNFTYFQIHSKNVVTHVVTRLDKLRFGLLYLQNQSGWLWTNANATIQKFITSKIWQNHPLRKNWPRFMSVPRIWRRKQQPSLSASIPARLMYWFRPCFRSRLPTGRRLRHRLAHGWRIRRRIISFTPSWRRLKVSSRRILQRLTLTERLSTWMCAIFRSRKKWMLNAGRWRKLPKPSARQ